MRLPRRAHRPKQPANPTKPSPPLSSNTVSTPITTTNNFTNVDTRSLLCWTASLYQAISKPSPNPLPATVSRVLLACRTVACHHCHPLSATKRRRRRRRRHQRSPPPRRTRTTFTPPPPPPLRPRQLGIRTEKPTADHVFYASFADAPRYSGRHLFPRRLGIGFAIWWMRACRVRSDGAGRS